ncbi:MAG: symporter-like protein [Methylocystis sp.]|nr:symporter-like protein [Methylocystis sp.]
MRDPATRAALSDRSSLDGRIAFVVATFALAYALVALLDRVGAPERLVGVISPYFTIAAMALLGFLLHSMRISRYYAAGRAVPASYAGFANAAIVISLAAPFAPRLADEAPLGGVLAGFLIGVAGVALFLGPLLRKTGAFSLSDLLAARFSRLEPRLGMIAATAVASACVALAGYQSAVDVLTSFTGTGRVVGAFVTGAAILLIAGPGGLSGVIWVASAAAGLIIAGFGLPAAILGSRGFPAPLPILGDAQLWSEAVARMEAWRIVTPSAALGLDVVTALAVALGIFTLAPVLAPAVATPEAASARRAGCATLFWTLVMAALVVSTIAASTLAVSRLTAGQAPERLPDAFYTASAHGFIGICGAHVQGPAEAHQACAARQLPPATPLRAEDVDASGEYLVRGLPELAGLGAALSGLVASALIAVGLVLAASGLQACATALGHSAFYRLRDEAALTSRRLAITRLVLVAITAFGSASSAADAFDPRALAGLALALSAAGVTPLVVLALWPRAGERDAMVALFCGLSAMALVIAANGGAPGIAVFAVAGLAGFTLGAGAGALSALCLSGGSPESRAFVNQVLRGEGETLGPDKGA